MPMATRDAGPSSSLIVSVRRRFDSVIDRLKSAVASKSELLRGSSSTRNCEGSGLSVLCALEKLNKNNF
jgi:hypothetical protein